jgi:Na+-transporting NADH:ubiquinone oxidoreductase subunit NqrC
MSFSANDVLTIVTILAVAIVASVWVAARHLSASRQARAQLTSGTQYHALADEFRRLSDMAITAQEHVDLRLTDLSVQVDSLKDQQEQMQRILKEVE